MGFLSVLKDLIGAYSVYVCLCVCVCSRKKDVGQMRQMRSKVRSRPVSVACLCVNSLKSFVGET